MVKTFLIKYNVTTKNGTYYNKEIKVHKDNELYAKVGLEGYLRKKYKDDFISLQITECKEDYVGMFNTMFGGVNNFDINNIFGSNYGK